MTMHLLPAYYTTNSAKKRKVANKSAKKAAADEAHKAYLAKITGGKKADKKLLDRNWKSRYNDDMMVDRSGYVSAGLSGSSDACAKRGVMTNLHKETEAVRKEILDKASRVMPLFNKGGLQYATPGTDMTQVGSKSRRG